MNLRNMFMKKVFDEDELLAIRDALSADDVIIPALEKLLEARLNECKPSKDMLSDVAYSTRRAAKDGAQIELEWLVEQFIKTPPIKVQKTKE